MELPRLLAGPLPSLPVGLDAAARAWAGSPPRVRVAVRVLAAAVVLSWLAGARTDGTFGPPVTVAQAVRELPAGAVVTPDDVVAVAWPAGLVPDGVPVEVAVGQRLRLGVAPGSAVREPHLGPAGLPGLIPAGHAALALPIDEAPPLRPGDLVDLHAPDAPAGVGAVVVAVETDVVWVAVPRGPAGHLAVALARGPVAITLLSAS